MKTEKKIFLERDETFDAVQDRFIEAAVDRVILNIPRDSLLGAKEDYFTSLKQKSMELGRELVVESVDEHILELAKLASITAYHPFFRREGRAVSDVLPRVTPKRYPDVSPKETAAVAKSKTKPTEIIEPPKISAKKNIQTAPSASSGSQEKESAPVESAKSVKKSKAPITRLVGVFIILGLLAGGGYVVLFRILPRATITVGLKKAIVPFEKTVTVSKAVQAVEVKGDALLIPGELLIAKRNMEMKFPAHGEENVISKAEGVLTVSNAYSSEPQILVQRTRFESPQGKVFRLDERVTIPGAKIADGKIVPSKIEVQVTADGAGEAYNIPPTGPWRIPGFAGTPKYEKFTAESGRPMTGGFAGKRPVPTEDDLAAAKKQVRETLEEALRNELLVSLDQRFTLLSGGASFTIIREEVTAPATPGMFGLFMEAELRHMVFEEMTLRETLEAIAKKELAGDRLKVKQFGLNYGTSTLDATKGMMTVAVSGSLVFESDIEVATLKTQLLGKGEEVGGVIAAIPGLDRANLSLWPFWVRQVPKNPEKVRIFVE